MSAKTKATFQSLEMTLSYEAKLSEEDAAKALRMPMIEGLAPSIDYIEICAPLRTPTMVLEHARRDAPKFKEAAKEIAAFEDKRAAIEQVSRFLGGGNTLSKDRGR